MTVGPPYLKVHRARNLNLHQQPTKLTQVRKSNPSRTNTHTLQTKPKRANMLDECTAADARRITSMETWPSYRFTHGRVWLLASNGVLPVAPLLPLLRVLLLAKHWERVGCIDLADLREKHEQSSAGSASGASVSSNDPSYTACDAGPS